MLARISAMPSARPLVRAFHASRLAHAALVQVYELLLPGGRRPVPAPPLRTVASQRPAPRRAEGQ